MGKNRRNTTAKEQMLKKIRQALLQKRDNPYPHFEDASLYRNDNRTMPLSIMFAERLTEAGGRFVYCENELQLAENLLALIEAENLQQIFATERPVQQFLSHYEFPFVDSELNVSGEATVGITSCEALIARHGSVLLSSTSGSGGRLSISPTIHVVLARSTQLKQELHDALLSVHEHDASALPSSITIVTGATSKMLVFFLDF